MWETGGALGGGDVDVLSAKLLTGGQSEIECGRESSSFFMTSNLITLEDDGSVGSSAGGS